MESKCLLDVFHPYKPLLHIVTVYHSKHFQDPNRRNLSIGYAIVFTTFIFGIIVLFVGDSWYCYSHGFDLREIALPFGVLISGAQISINYTAIAIKYQSLERSISELRGQIHIRCRLSAKSFAKYEKIEKTFAYITKIFTKGLTYITIFFFAIIAFIPVSYKLFQYPLPNQWQTIHGYRLPLSNEMNVFLRYYIDWVNQLLASGAYYTLLSTIVLFFVGMYLYIIEMVEDLRDEMNDLDANFGTITQKLIIEIEFHNEILGIANMFRDIMSIGLFFQLLVCATSLAIYMVAIASNPTPNVNFFTMLIGLSLTISSTSVFCYFSEQLTTKLDVVGDIFYDVAWYRLTSKQQILIKLPIQRSQINFRLTGLEIIECSLSVLLKIFRASWSYFLIMYGIS